MRRIASIAGALALALPAAGQGYVEDYEAFPVGRVGEGNFFITDVAPIGGARSAIHVSDGTGDADFDLESPDFTPFFGSLTATVRITGTGTLYQFIALDTGNSFFITRINFETDGRIRVGQADPDPDVDGFRFFDTGIPWTVNVPMSICLTVDADGTLAVFVNGDLGLLGRSAADVAFAEGDAMTPPAGIGRAMTFASNDGVGDVETFGDGDPANDVALGTGDNYVIDDFVAECDGAIPPRCPTDVNGNGVTDVDDLIFVVLDFGGDGARAGTDVDASGLVDVDDVIAVILAFGPCPVLGETCDDAVTVFFGGSYPFERGATNDGAPLACGVPVLDDVWFVHRPSSGCGAPWVTFDTIGSGLDTVIEVYEGVGCPVDALPLIACDDDIGFGGDPLASEVVIGLDSNVPLTVRIGFKSPPGSMDSGVLNITYQFPGAPPPFNDQCSNPTLLNVGPGGSVSFGDSSLTGAPDPLETLACSGLAVGPGIWYEVDGTGETMTATLCGSPLPFENILHVYCGDPTDCGPNSTLTCAVADYDGCGMPDDLPVTAAWCSDPDQTYMIHVAAAPGDECGGAFMLTVSSDGVACTTAMPCEPLETNDACADAFPIAQGSTAYNNVGATTDGPAHVECEDGGDGGQTTEDLWFAYTAAPAAVPQVLLVTTCEELGGSAAHDTDLVLYEGTSCVEADLLANLVACNDDDPVNACGTGAGGFHSTIVAPVTPGLDYLVRVGSWNVGETGPGVLFVSQFEPTDDFCDFASPIAADGVPVAVDTSAATIDGAFTCDNGPMFDAPGVWLTTTGDGTEYTITTCSVTPAFWDTRLTVYCGGCDDLACVGENSDNELVCGPNESLTWCTFPGLEYTILVAGTGGASGVVDVTITAGAACSDPACLPADGCGSTAYQPYRPPDDGPDLHLSDPAGGVTRYESFDWPGGPIAAIRWWGGNGRFIPVDQLIGCYDSLNNIVIRLHGDDGTGRPNTSGIVVFQEATGGPVLETTIDIVEVDGFSFALIEYETPAMTPFDPTVLIPGSPAYYLSITDADGDICMGLWADSRIGDGRSWSLGPSDTVPVVADDAADLSFCIEP